MQEVVGDWKAIIEWRDEDGFTRSYSVNISDADAPRAAFDLLLFGVQTKKLKVSWRTAKITIFPNAILGVRNA